MQTQANLKHSIRRPELTRCARGRSTLRSRLRQGAREVVLGREIDAQSASARHHLVERRLSEAAPALRIWRRTTHWTSRAISASNRLQRCTRNSKPRRPRSARSDRDWLLANICALKLLVAILPGAPSFERMRAAAKSG